MPIAAECLDALRKAKDAGNSLSRIGAMLKWAGKPRGYTRAAISAMLSGTYKARDTSKVEAAIRATLLRETVACPALGDIPMADCGNWQSKAQELAATNPLRVRMYRACRACPQFKGCAGRKEGGAP